jgi:hypothetical protein
VADALCVGTRQIGGALSSTLTILNCAVAPLYPDLALTLVFEAFLDNQGTSKDVFLADNCLCIHTGTDLHIWTVFDREVVPTATLP